ncbi:MAG: DUF951 domain-containing protein [Caldilineales bacterium]|nr:DUF951 domain-containing protein [Caldilineales bacterium]
MPSPNFQVGDTVRLRKQHACGGWEWVIVRTGADIGIVCQTCKRRLLLPRDKFRRALKQVTKSAEPIVAEPDDGGALADLSG